MFKAIVRTQNCSKSFVGLNLREHPMIMITWPITNFGWRFIISDNLLLSKVALIVQIENDKEKKNLATKYHWSGTYIEYTLYNGLLLYLLCLTQNFVLKGPYRDGGPKKYSFHIHIIILVDFMMQVFRYLVLFHCYKEAMKRILNLTSKSLKDRSSKLLYWVVQPGKWATYFMEPNNNIYILIRPRI